jgi:hypothetical protein
MKLNEECITLLTVAHTAHNKIKRMKITSLKKHHSWTREVS